MAPTLPNACSPTREQLLTARQLLVLVVAERPKGKGGASVDAIQLSAEFALLLTTISTARRQAIAAVLVAIAASEDPAGAVLAAVALAKAR